MKMLWNARRMQWTCCEIQCRYNENDKKYNVNTVNMLWNAREMRGTAMHSLSNRCHCTCIAFHIMFIVFALRVTTCPLYLHCISHYVHCICIAPRTICNAIALHFTWCLCICILFPSMLIVFAFHFTARSLYAHCISFNVHCICIAVPIMFIVFALCSAALPLNISHNFQSICIAFHIISIMSALYFASFHYSCNGVHINFVVPALCFPSCSLY